MSRKVVICGFARSPFHFANRGALARVRPDELLAQTLRGLLERVPVPREEIEDVIVGCAFPEAEQGLNLARLAVFLTDLPEHVAGVTVNRFCGSSMQAAHIAAGAIATGSGDLFLCAGVESMTRVPIPGFNPMPHPGLAARFPQAYMGMGETAENVAERWKIPRERQERFALESHRKAAAARTTGRFRDEIVPVVAKDGTIEEDGCIREDTSLERLATLEPAFRRGGTVTAGTSSPLTDGAAAVIVAEEGFARANGLPVMARIRAMAVAGCAPEIMGIGPVAATRRALSRAGLQLSDIDIVELNEAFAAQALAVVDELSIPEEKLNLDGGAIALGHPLGASGARILGKAAQLLVREDRQFALATMCIGGGQGIATVLERAA